ncbi:hypothetical protein EYF80_058214 [Liparis tanakae]|uniref:Uncharacterized protein n=1 Tax=Liparis tanakae TaxID=230148 RepID=A0A4Z2ES39_9TELE|nr:hypothetical protein EYF80_058214 [Liparis tanakae]
MSNIEWGQIDPKGHTRLHRVYRLGFGLRSLKKTHRDSKGILKGNSVQNNPTRGHRLLYGCAWCVVRGAWCVVRERPVLQGDCAVVGLGGGKSSVKLTLHMSLPQQQKWYVPFWICGGRLVTTQRSSLQLCWSPRPKQWLPTAHRMVVFSGDTRPSPPATRSTSRCCCWSVKAQSLSSPCATVGRRREKVGG